MGKLIDLGKEQELPARDLVRELIEWFVDDVLDELGSRKEVEYAFKILDEGTSADRQLARFRQTGDLNAVVDALITETAEGVVDSVEPVSPFRVSTGTVQTFASHGSRTAWRADRSSGYRRRPWKKFPISFPAVG